LAAVQLEIVLPLISSFALIALPKVLDGVLSIHVSKFSLFLRGWRFARPEKERRREGKGRKRRTTEYMD